MKYIALILVVIVATVVPCEAAMQKYVKPGQILPEKEAVEKPVITTEMKQAALAIIDANGYLTELDVKVITKTNRSVAREVIADFVAEGKLKTYEDRYNELYPPSTETP